VPSALGKRIAVFRVFFVSQNGGKAGIYEKQSKEA
jgi:hypothetical protein